VTDKGYNLGNTTYFCSRPSDFALMALSYVYWRDVRLGERDSGPIQESVEDLGQPIIYDIFLAVARQAVTPSNPPQISFDLRRLPEDVCFYLRGGNGGPFGFKSNVVTIPKGAIAATLQKTPTTLGGR
jgi:hypothetical protein